ncbi:MAG: hypothetical protein BWY93_02044 [Euryarchaeota archaeon ADurb.BinA087]|nr:MAG: hypothetical protein BWY93_02044 [Euryarchaeota archaeon ADurb.BinA087]
MRPGNHIIARRSTSHPLEFPGMGGKDTIPRLWYRQPEGICIEDHSPAGRSKCSHHMVTPAAETVPHYHYVSTVNQGKNTVDMFCTDDIPFETFIDEFWHGLKYRRGNPDNICSCPESPETTEVGGSLVGSPSNNKDLSSASLVCIRSLFPDGEEVPGPCEEFRLKWNSYLSDSRSRNFRPMKRKDMISPDTRSRDIC